MPEREPPVIKSRDPLILGLLIGDKVRLSDGEGAVVYKGEDWEGKYGDICVTRTAFNCSQCERRDKCNSALIVHEHFSEIDPYSQDFLCHEKDNKIS